jgi:hypothetical protein
LHEPNFTGNGDSTADESRSAVNHPPRRGGELSSNQARYLVSHGSLPPVKRKECPVCLRPFIPPRGGRGNYPLNSIVYCSITCKKQSQILRREWYKAQSMLRRAMTREGKTCQFCRKPFTALRSDSKYCSGLHRELAYLRRKKATNQAPPLR